MRGTMLALIAIPSLAIAAHRPVSTHDRPNIDAIVRQFHVNFSNGEVRKNGDLVSDSLVVNLNGGAANRAGGATFKGREEFVAWLQSEKAVFPDGKITDHEILVAGNKAAIRFTFDGTQTAPLPTPEGPIAATGRKIHIEGTEFFTFDEGGKLVHLETLSNDLSLLAQLRAPS